MPGTSLLQRLVEMEKDSLEDLKKDSLVRLKDQDYTRVFNQLKQSPMDVVALWMGLIKAFHYEPRAIASLREKKADAAVLKLTDTEEIILNNINASSSSKISAETLLILLSSDIPGDVDSKLLEDVASFFLNGTENLEKISDRFAKELCEDLLDTKGEIKFSIIKTLDWQEYQEKLQNPDTKKKIILSYYESQFSSYSNIVIHYISKYIEEKGNSNQQEMGVKKLVGNDLLIRDKFREAFTQYIDKVISINSRHSRLQELADILAKFFPEGMAVSLCSSYVAHDIDSLITYESSKNVEVVKMIHKKITFWLDVCEKLFADKKPSLVSGVLQELKKLKTTIFQSSDLVGRCKFLEWSVLRHKQEEKEEESVLSEESKEEEETINKDCIKDVLIEQKAILAAEYICQRFIETPQEYSRSDKEWDFYNHLKKAMVDGIKLVATLDDLFIACEIDSFSGVKPKESSNTSIKNTFLESIVLDYVKLTQNKVSVAQSPYSTFSFVSSIKSAIASRFWKKQ